MRKKLKEARRKAGMTQREQTTIRLTIRVPEELDGLLREESVRRGTNVNQTMLYILNQYFKNHKD